jgi:hypothetical protein
LRKNLEYEYLGIEAEMLSEGLLRELCDRSAIFYERFLDHKAGSMESELRFAFPHGLSDRVADYLIRQTEIHKALDSPITYILELCDMPDVIEFIVKKAADVNRSITGAGNFSFWTQSLVDIWDHTRGLGKRLSAASMERLLSLWQNWLQYAHNVWCDELKAVVEEHLESFTENIPRDFSGGFLNRHYEVSGLLANIPIEDAVILLDKHWPHLGYGGKFIQTALGIGTPRCLQLASENLSRCQRDTPVLKHFFMDFRFIIGRLSNEESIRRVKNLDPTSTISTVTSYGNSRICANDSEFQNRVRNILFIGSAKNTDQSTTLPTRTS